MCNTLTCHCLFSSAFLLEVVVGCLSVYSLIVAEAKIWLRLIRSRKAEVCPVPSNLSNWMLNWLNHPSVEGPVLRESHDSTYLLKAGDWPKMSTK